MHQKQTHQSLYILLLLLLLHLHLLPQISSANSSQPYIPLDLILLSCGSSSSSTSLDGRHWDSDFNSTYHSSQPLNSSSSFPATQQHGGSVAGVPYLTARIFYTNFTYSFPVSPGPKFLRLYFHLASYSVLNVSNSVFSLFINNHILLSNFSAFSTISAKNTGTQTLVKEYIVKAEINQKLNLTFIPSPESFAFVNGIEIVSMPDDLYIRGDDNPLPFVGFDYFSYLNTNTALETLYRLNVGGNDIGGSGDTGMFRTWLQDTVFLSGHKTGQLLSGSLDKIVYTPTTPVFVAPELVYKSARSMSDNDSASYNLTWRFDVDSGFNYLVRLHFCEMRQVVSGEGMVLFYIFINNQTAEQDADVIHWSGGNGIPVYRDYVVWVPQVEGGRTKPELWLGLHPNFDLKPALADAILNGVEIFKLNDSGGSLASPNPEPPAVPLSPDLAPSLLGRKKGSLHVLIECIIGGVLGIVFVVVVVGVLCSRRRRVMDSDESKGKSIARKVSLRPSVPFRRFSIFEIEVATSRFDDEFIIGSGGFGNVYKGYIDDGVTPVAIKRLHSLSRQGAREFKTEIQLLAKLQNPNLVSLIGYCNDPGEMVLVYEYMHRGTLRNHLYRTRNPPLSWRQRLQICIGAARGLSYLHTNAKPQIIHRDVKSTNILIDENWVAKVSDFGLSRTGPSSNSQTHVSTVVRGSLGYVDPEYYRRQHLTEKSDVYSFGVVLLEVLCARPPLIPELPKEQVNLADWARMCSRRGDLGQIMDPNLIGDIAPASLEKYGEIVNNCLLDQGTSRPTMSAVVSGLELVLQLQESYGGNRTGSSCDTSNSSWGIISKESESLVLLVRHEAVTTDDDDLLSGFGAQKEESESSISCYGRSGSQDDLDGLKSATVFSEIENPKGG